MRNGVSSGITNRGIEVRRALLSVSDKTGLIPLAKFLHARDVELISTGGTAQALQQVGLPVTPIEKVTQNPEAFGGRVKTLSFEIASSILFRRSHESDVQQAKQLGIQPIDLLVCNLYPFEKTVSKTPVLSEWIENIDIGGPTLIRAAAKNYTDVVCLVDPADYETWMREVERSGGMTSIQSREKWAMRAFQRIAAYDLNIAFRLSQVWGENTRSHLRYGENPHQSAAWLPFENTIHPDGEQAQGWAVARVLQGQELSYNNWLDADSALKVVSDLDGGGLGQIASVAIIKHGNPCGVAAHVDLYRALELAWEADAVSAFGGIVAFSKPVTVREAEFFEGRFVEVLIAPGFSEEARARLQSKKKLRLMETPLRSPREQEWTLRSVWGGLLAQAEDQIEFPAIRSVTSTPLPAELNPLIRFGWLVNRYLKSNCIGVYTEKSGGWVLLAAGTGQPNRLDCIRWLVAPKLRESAWSPEKTVLVSDAFFPFRDTIDAIHELGIRFVVQPGGSVRDPEVIAACEAHQIQMGLTGIRNFRH